MSELKSLIKDSLNGDMLENALDFTAFLEKNDMFFKDSAVSFQNEVVCYMHIDSGEEEPSPWTIWTEGNYSHEIEGVSIDEHTKEIAWKHVNICASCGDCSPGKRKVIFGKEFDNVCNADMAFYCPDAKTLECVKKLLQMRKNNIAL
jgi:hypothetical protein